ncbi:MAG: hypothetical protein AVDCRST_MAG30-1160, partial [uncultured Solirubrobacteraceae bacterium]
DLLRRPRDPLRRALREARELLRRRSERHGDRRPPQDGAPRAGLHRRRAARGARPPSRARGGRVPADRDRRGV